MAPHEYCSQRLLLPDGAITVNPAASKKAVMHHAVTQQKEEDCQECYEQELSSSKRRWFRTFRARRIPRRI
jgi:hypothetical protein